MKNFLFPPGFFTSKPVWVVILFCIGVAAFSRLACMQERDLFMSDTEILKRFPTLPSEVQTVVPPPQFELKSATNLLTNFSTVGIPGFRGGRSAMDHFFRKLEGAQKGGEVRVLFYGDSQLWGDNVTRRVRQRLLEHVPNGGRGLIPVVLEAGPNGDYVLSGVEQTAGEGWTVSMLETMQHYKMEVGITLRTYRAARDGAWTRVRLPRNEVADSFAILAEPAQIPVSVRFVLTNDQVQTHSLPALTKTCTVLSNAIPWKEATITAGRGSKFYGFDVRRKSGLRFSSIIRKGICSHDFPNITEGPFRQGIADLKPDLLIWYFGKNESGWNQYTHEKYLSGMHWTLSNVRAASPNTSILFIGPGPRMNIYRGPPRLFPTIPEMRQLQHDFGQKYGVAYYDSFNALGGVEGFMDMVRRGIAMTDYVHLTFRGGDVLADSIADNILAAWAAWLYETWNTPKEVSLLSRFSETRGGGTAGGDGTGGGVAAGAGTTGGGTGGITGNNAGTADAPAESTAITFDTVRYGFFLVIVFFVWWMLFHAKLLRVVFLLAASWFFYMSWNPIFVFLIIFSCGVDYLMGMLIHSAHTRGRRGLAKLWLTISLVSSLGLLFFFKYFNFFSDVLFQLGIREENANILTLILPVGISFYTFQTMSYVLDIYRGVITPTRSFAKFALFVSFFPQLVAGPIVRARDFLPQLMTKPNFDPLLMCNGFFFILVGLFKKIIISDFLALNLVDRVFASPTLYSPIEVLLGIYAYGLQIYCDFSGYSDIAIGSAALFGFRLPINFNSPYKAQNLQDFWHRWHITLSTWLRDYLYIPLGGNRKGNARTYINLAITMLLGGLWHGADYRFIIWGALHGFGLGVVRAFQRRRKSKATRGGKGESLPPRFGPGKSRVQSDPLRLGAQPPSPRANSADSAAAEAPEHAAPQRFNPFSWLLTIHFVMFAWIFFRAPDMDTVGGILEKLAGLPAAFAGLIAAVFNGGMGAYAPNITSLIGLILLGGFVLHFLPERVFERTRSVFVAMPAFFQAYCLLIFMALFYKTATTAFVPFIYFQF